MNILIAHFCTHWVQCSGGVEKVVCKFANEMLKRGHEVTVLYIDQKEGAPFFPLDHRVKTINILYENGQKLFLKNYRSDCVHAESFGDCSA